VGTGRRLDGPLPAAATGGVGAGAANARCRAEQAAGVRPGQPMRAVQGERGAGA
jgi:hypothetical protein